MVFLRPHKPLLILRGHGMETTVTAALKPSLLPSPNHKTLFITSDRLCVTVLKFSTLYPYSSAARPLTLRCTGGNGSSSEKGEPRNLKDALSGMVDARLEELLTREENRVLFDGLEQATRRVELAKKELAEIERQEVEAKAMRDYINQLETRASEIAECQKDIAEARAMIKEAEQALGSGEALGGAGNEAMSINADKLESVKAALISAVVGTIAGLPISLTRVATTSELILPLAITFVSCALFGVTFRYAVRRDLDNFHLKSGTSAAFGFVKGLATLSNGPPLELNSASFISHALDGATSVSENLLIFLFAAVGLDLCIKLRILSPFPIDRSAQD
nr:homer protein [Ipomoea batatas]